MECNVDSLSREQNVKYRGIYSQKGAKMLGFVVSKFIAGGYDITFSLHFLTFF